MSHEKKVQLPLGWMMLGINLMFLLGVTPAIFLTGVLTVERNPAFGGPLIVLAIVTFICTIISLNGHVTLQPNEAVLYTLFGSYVGTARESGFWWANPFRTKRKLSLRARNFESTKLKVNDKQ